MFVASQSLLLAQGRFLRLTIANGVAAAMPLLGTIASVPSQDLGVVSVANAVGLVLGSGFVAWYAINPGNTSFRSLLWLMLKPFALSAVPAAIALIAYSLCDSAPIRVPIVTGAFAIAYYLILRRFAKGPLETVTFYTGELLRRVQPFGRSALPS
jgi:hypothetical protein